MNVIDFANCHFKGLTKDLILRESDELKFIVTVNAEMLVIANENEKMKNIIDNNYATFDGQTPYLLAKMSNRGEFFEKISGSDLIYDFCTVAKDRKYKIFLLGGFEDSNRHSVERARNEFDVSAEGYSPPKSDYPFSGALNEDILSRIREYKPEILLVALGVPKEEFWIDDHKKALYESGVRYVIGVGGTFELFCGMEKKAPKIIQVLALECIWRLIFNPKRLKRFLKSFKMFKYAWFNGRNKRNFCRKG